MKNTILTLAIIAAAPYIAKADIGVTNKAPNWGTDILHYFVRDHFDGTGVDSNASARVEFQQKSQGKADHQQLSLTARNLDPSATYTLLSAELGETNFTEVTQFTTDTKGVAKLKFKGVSAGNSGSNNSGNGNGNPQLPSALEPLIELGALAISDVNTQIVLQADLGTPDKLQYLVKRTLVGDTAAGLLRIQGTLSKTQFRLQAVNLAPTNDYWLAINETVVQTNTADSKGRLKINALTAPVGSPLNIEKVELLDTATNVVFGTELP
jgi:hypothetical protein